MGVVRLGRWYEAVVSENRGAESFGVGVRRDQGCFWATVGVGGRLLLGMLHSVRFQGGTGGIDGAFGTKNMWLDLE